MQFHNMRNLIPSFLALFAVTVLFGSPAAFAYVASSSNYRIQTDSVNVGGLFSSSTSYRAEDTVGESGVGTSSSASFAIKGGYQQMQDVYLAVAPSGNVTLTPNIPATGGGAADALATFVVTTDNIAGYSMNIASAQAPALNSGANNFPNYIPGGANPDFTFTTPAASSRFGFSPEGTDIVQRYKDNGASCNVGATDTSSACWDALSTTPISIASRSSANNPSGTQTAIRFHAASGASNTQPAGSYVATATVTVLPL